MTFSMLRYISTRHECQRDWKDLLFQSSALKPPDEKVDIMGKPLGPR